MSAKNSFYIGTVCLERNRWGSRVPSFAVSEWLPRFTADGFDGVELWENHYLAADDNEKAELVRGSSAIEIFNSYAKFDDESNETRAKAALAAAELDVAAVKYNLGPDRAKIDEYRRNLIDWAGRLPDSCRLLCECHQGTVLEKVVDAAAFFADLDPVRFGVIVHVSAGAQGQLGVWMKAFGARVQHLHVQMRGPESDPQIPAARENLDSSFGVIKSNRFAGSVAMEFTRGIGREEDIEVIYANVRRDLAYCMEVLL